MDSSCEQMVYAEATTVVPLIFSYVYHNTDLKSRKRYAWSKMLDTD